MGLFMALIKKTQKTEKERALGRHLRIQKQNFQSDLNSGKLDEQVSE